MSKLSRALWRRWRGGQRRAGHYVTGIWIPPPIPPWSLVDWAVKFSPISAKRKRARMKTNIKKHMPRVMTPLLMSSPPTSISHCLFRCRYSNSRDAVARSPFYSHPAARAPRRACSQTRYIHNVLPTMLSIHLNIYPCAFLACRVSISSLVLISLSLRL